MATIYGHQCDLTLFRRAYLKISQELIRTNAQTRRDGSIKASPNPEPFRSCLAAEFHRQFWKPAEPRLVLLAESHVYTDELDLACKITTNNLPTDIQHSSSQFVRLIYCLGYGESTLVRGTPVQPNDGTPQYWKIFGQCAGTSATADGSLNWKISTLRALKARGIWLADASIHACMNPRFPKTDPRRHLAKFNTSLYQKVLSFSWQYVKTTIQGCPEIWTIGDGVHRALSDPILSQSKWLYQPNGARTTEQRAEYARQTQRLLAAINAACLP
jgi:hypothetical protein